MHRQSLAPLGLLAALVASGPVVAQTATDSVRVTRSVATWSLDNGTCAAGVIGTWPDAAARVLDTETSYDTYRLVVVDGSFIPRGNGEIVPANGFYDEVPAGHYGHDPRLPGGSVPCDERFGELIAAANARVATGATFLLNGASYTMGEWYATYSVPDGTPVAEFVWEQTGGLTVSFDGSFERELSREVTAEGPVPVVDYEWDFGDGSAGFGATPEHTYDEPGTYTVALTVTDDDGETNTATYEVDVAGAILAYRVVAPEEVAPKDTLRLEIQVTNEGTVDAADVTVQRDLVFVPTYPTNPQGFRRNAQASAPLLGTGDTTVTSGLAVGATLRIQQAYVIEQAAFVNEARVITKVPVDWEAQVVAISGEDVEGRAAKTGDACADGGCDNVTRIESPALDLAVQTTTTLGTEPVPTSTVFSGLVVGPRPVLDGVTVSHRIRSGGESRCRTGCIDFEAAATDPETGDPAVGVRLDVRHPAIAGPGVVTPAQGGGFLCERGSASPVCGQSITLTTDEDGLIKGSLSVPGVISTTPVDLTAAVSPSENFVGKATHTITIEPNPVYANPIPVDAQQAEDLGSAAAIQAGFQRFDLLNKLCTGIKKAFDVNNRKFFVFNHSLSPAFLDKVCKNVNELTLGQLVQAAQQAAQMPQMAWLFESAQIPDNGLATTSAIPLGVTSQFVDEISRALQGRLDDDGEMQPGAAPFQLFEVSYLGRNAVEQNALYFSLWDHRALVTKDYDAGLWLLERYETSVLPPTELGSPAPPGGTTISVGTGASPEGAPPATLLARQRVQTFGADTLRVNDLVVLSPDDPERAEVVRLMAVSGSPESGQTAELASPLVYGHPAGSALRVIGSGEAVPPPPYLVTPTDTVGTTDNVRLAWALLQPVAEVDVELARDAAFADVVVSETLAGAEVLDGALTVGVSEAGLSTETPYYWRARVRDRAGESAWSDTTRFVLSMTGTAVEDAPSGSPEVLSLAAYPNPAAQTVRLRVGVPAAGPLRVTLYDALGRQMVVVADARRPAGRHEVAVQVSGLPSGVYVVRAEAGGRSVTQTLTVVR
jgi:PKD repeat protein